MKALLRLIIIVLAFFTAVFILFKITGLITLSDIKSWLIAAQDFSPVYVSLAIIFLLFADLFISVPTLSLTILAGFFLGPLLGASSALTGIVLAGVCGHVLSRYYGQKILGFILKDEQQRQEAIEGFQQHGFMLILLSRAIPILPEVTACLSGLTRMPFHKFMLAWLASAIPYVSIAAYAGSISTVENPAPGIISAVAISATFWIGGMIYHRHKKIQQSV